MKILITLAVAVSLAAATDPDWSRFRGPNGTGIAETTGLPSEFGPAKNVVWKAAVPAGHSSPVLTRSHIFMTGIEGNTLLVLALDRASGKELWRREVPRPGTLVVAGGETLRGLCAALEATTLEVQGQIEPGLPYSRLRGGRWDSVEVVSKSGAFGRPEIWRDLLHLNGANAAEGQR